MGLTIFAQLECTSCEIISNNILLYIKTLYGNFLTTCLNICLTISQKNSRKLRLGFKGIKHLKKATQWSPGKTNTHRHNINSKLMNY